MFGSDGSPVIQYVSIFAVIFAVLTVVVLLVRRFSGGGLAIPGRNGPRGRQPRLGIVDVYELDRQRQLILLRRDNVEHLLLVGGPNDVVIERNIQRGRALAEPALRPEPLPEAMPDALSDPDEPALGPPPPLPEIPQRRPEAGFEPSFEMPVVVPAGVPRSSAAPPVTQPLDAASVGPDEPAPEVAGVVTGPRPEDRPAPTTPAREGPAKRLLRRTAPALINPKPEPAPPASPAVPETAVPAGPPRRAVDPAILSDMARQLQAALGRSSSAVTPPPVAPGTPAASEPISEPASEPAPAPAAPPAPETPAAQPPAPAIDPMAAAMAGTPEPAAPRPEPEASRSEPAGARPEPARPPAQAEAPPEPRPDPRPAPPAPAPVPAPPPAAEAARTAAGPAPGKPGSAANPFSVEEIEAEFARLLGRPLDKRN